MSNLNQVYLSLSSDPGSRQSNILQARRYVRARTCLKTVSSFYESEPEEYPDQPMFLNAACCWETELPPGDVPDDSFVLAKQGNFEGVHRHNACAERFGTHGEVRRELMSGDQVIRHTTVEEWLKR
jgi:hypothetical protein